MEQAALHKIKQLQQRYIGYQLLADALLATGCAFLIASILYRPWQARAVWCGIVSFMVVMGILATIRRPWNTTLATLCRYLNVTYPQLEESSALVIKPAAELNLLESLQRSKVEQEIVHLPGQPPLVMHRVKKAAGLLALALILSAGMLWLGKHWPTAKGGYYFGDKKTTAQNAAPPEKVLPQIDGVTLKITPPAYTGKPARQQDKFTIIAEEGAVVTWHISTNIAVNSVTLLFNEHEKLALTHQKSTEWAAQRLLSKPGFYQVSIDGKLSDLYQIQVVKDELPAIHIKSPRQYTHIDAGEVPRVIINANVSDDYGVNNAQIFATVAKGSGESVKFKDTVFSFNTSFGKHNRQYNLQRTIDLPKLNMKPGDELYFYVQAQDTHQQKNRTDVLIVSIQDTAQLLSMDGLVAAANIKPEYFRSQRQIILDTEKLLKEKDSIGVTTFKNRCNDLGTDQKMLRLRYGKFLGDEEEGSHEDNEHDELGKAENFGNAAMVMDAYTDKHDNAEDATFLEPAVKAQLKATLNEMWKAELRLRLYKPLEALPFEYKALRLLKDLQQKSRSFVAKTNYNPPPLKPEKRLSGDLSKIGSPVNQQTSRPGMDKYETLKKAAGILEQSKHQALSIADKRILQLAAQQLAVRASAQPGIYLKAVGALRRMLTSNVVQPTDRSIIEKAIQKSLPSSKTSPYPASATADMGLAQRYYQNLNR
ncbi:DUF4175 family protein [Mucilaginibacter sp. PAMB04168]|uniref:DUF4175 family protein n=1 Tax=Mucilaginibacter sp. PAMB04168 TaxID=3138567 RepID=UPI0031F6CF32